MDALTLAVAAALVLFGRSLYWLFVGGIGFLLGFHYASQWLAESPWWMALAVALVIGIVGAALAVLLQRIAVAVAGFFGAGWFAMSVLPALGIAPGFATPVFLTAGILAAILVFVLLDPALIVLSSAIGAAMISDVFDPAWKWLVFAGVLAVGIVVQSSLLRQTPHRRTTAD